MSERSRVVQFGLKLLFFRKSPPLLPQFVFALCGLALPRHCTCQPSHTVPHSPHRPTHNPQWDLGHLPNDPNHPTDPSLFLLFRSTCSPECLYLCLDLAIEGFGILFGAWLVEIIKTTRAWEEHRHRMQVGIQIC